MTRPRVSVVIPTRNRWRFLSKTLQAALGQEGVRHEVIVVDDASSDETQHRLAAFDHPKLRVIRQEQHHGVAAARNAGIGEAQGEWIAFLDDDDVWSPGKLRAQLAASESRGAVFSYAAAVVVDERWRPIEVLPAPDPDDAVGVVLPTIAIPACASNVMASTEAVRALGGFDESFKQFADWELCIRLASTGPAAACPEVLLAYVHHRGGMLLTSDRGELVREFERLGEKHGDRAEQRGVHFDRAGLSDWMGWGEARAGRRIRAAAYYLLSALLYVRQGERWGIRPRTARAFAALRGERFLEGGRPVSSAAPVEEPEWLRLYR